MLLFNNKIQLCAENILGKMDLTISFTIMVVCCSEKDRLVYNPYHTKKIENTPLCRPPKEDIVQTFLPAPIPLESKNYECSVALFLNDTIWRKLIMCSGLTVDTITLVFSIELKVIGTLPKHRKFEAKCFKGELIQKSNRSVYYCSIEITTYSSKTIK